MKVQKGFGRWLLYGLCMAPAIVMLGYYALEYVPSQREYFISLRFRSLANIAGQTRMKLNSLLTALDYATRSDGQTSEYIRALVPDLTYPKGKCAESARGYVQFGADGQTVGFKGEKGCAAEASLPGIFAKIAEDDLFDDVIVAAADGRVLYQRSPTSPKIVSLGDLRKPAGESKSPSAASVPAEADTLRNVRLDESDFLLMMQPVRVVALDTPEKTLVVCGLVRAGRLAEESRHVPPLYLLVIFVPLLIVFLSGPFLKILLLTGTGRLAFRDLAMLSVCAVLTVALLTVLVASWRQYWTGDRQSEPDMKAFADSLDQQVAGDVRRMYGTLQELDGKLPPIEPGVNPDRHDLLSSEVAKDWTADSAPFDFVFWTNADGCQVAKWSTKTVNTQRVDQKTQAHFQDVIAQRFWSLHPNEKFSLHTLVSPTTSQLIVVLAIPSRQGRSAPCPSENAALRGAGPPSPILEAAIVGLLPSVTSPATPAGAGFAVFDRRGNVIFDSSPERNLYENLFDELRSPESWRAAVATGAERDGCAFYRGRKFQFHVQPVKQIRGSGWNIATFRELEPRQTMIGIVWAETLILFVAPLVLGGAALLLLAAVLRAARRQTWRAQLEFVLASVWPDPARAAVFRRLALELALLTAVSCAVCAIGSAYVYRASAWLLPFCYAAPLLGLALIAFRLRKPAADQPDDPANHPRRTACVECISLLLVLTAVVPVAGLFSICQAYESRLRLMHWQRALVESLQARKSRIESAINGSPAYSIAGKQRALTLFRLRENKTDRGGKDYMKHFWQTAEIAPGTEFRAGMVVSQGWQALLAAIRPETQSSAMESGALARAAGGTASWGWRTSPDASMLMLRRSSSDKMVLRSTLPQVATGRDPVFWLAVFALIAGGYAWNRRALGRIFLRDFDYIPLPPLTALPAPEELGSDVLLLGLPLARKDAAVREWLGYTPPRVNLYAARFTETWVAETCARLREELSADAGMALGASVGGGAAAARTCPRRWVHISNLESKLATPAERQAVTALLDSLIAMDVGGPRPRLIVTSTVDPVFHFDSVLSDERKEIYEHPLNEPELQRFSRLLHNFRKVEVPPPDPVRPAWATESEAGAAIYEECCQHQALLEIGAEVAAVAPPGSGRDTLLARIAERAHALYKLFWACCTRPEKLLLVQLAQTGLVNPLSLDTLQVLIRKGLVRPGPRPRIMNETFLRFLMTVEARAVVRQWETEAGESSWPVIRNVVLVLIAVGVAVIAMTQRDAMQTVTAVLTGVATVMAGLFRLAGYFGNRRAAPAESE